MLGSIIGPGGSPLYRYVLYGLSTVKCLLSTRLIVKSLFAKMTVGSACNNIPFSSLLRYNPAISGISSVCNASPLTIEARILTSWVVKLIAVAFSLRSAVQNLLYSSWNRAIILLGAVFQ